MRRLLTHKLRPLSLMHRPLTHKLRLLTHMLRPLTHKLRLLTHMLRPLSLMQRAQVHVQTVNALEHPSHGFLRGGFNETVTLLWHSRAPMTSVDMSAHPEFLAGPDPSRPRVLVVADDAVTRKLIHAALLQASVDAVSAADGAEARTMLTRGPWTAAIVDLHVPDGGGLDLVQLMRISKPGIPIIAIGATSAFETKIAALRAGASAYYEKTGDWRALACRVVMLIHPTAGVLTRRAFLDRAEAVVASEPDGGRRHCIAMIDIDHLKYVTDHYGPAAGDRVLFSLSETLRRRARANDLVGRYGSEGFSLLLENVDEQAAAIILEKILAHFSLIEHHVTPVFTISATFSAGVAAIHPEEETVADAIARADLALHRAKSAGRNRVMASMWSSPEKSTASAIHPGTLEELRRLGVTSGHDVLREVVELFLALAPEQLDAIQRAVQTHDPALLCREAHALRGAAASTGLTGVVAACERLERIGSEQRWDDAGAAVDGLLKTYITGRDALSGAAGFNLRGFN